MGKREKVVYVSNALHQSRRLVLLVFSALYSEYINNYFSGTYSSDIMTEITKDFIDITREINTLFNPETSPGDSIETLVSFADTFDIEDKIERLLNRLKNDSLIPSSFRVKIVIDEDLSSSIRNQIIRLFSKFIVFIEQDETI